MAIVYKDRVKAIEATTADALANKIEKIKGNPKFMVERISEPYFANGAHIVIVWAKVEEETP